MFKKLDKYMDDLKSPYWEIYIYLIAITFLMVGTITIFFGDHGLGQKFANFGSFLGGIIALIALLYTRHEYLRLRGLNERIGMITNTLPRLKGFLSGNFVMIASNYHTVTCGFKCNKTGIDSDYLEEFEREDIDIENQMLIEELGSIWREYKVQHIKILEAGADLTSSYLDIHEQIKVLIESLDDVLFFIAKSLKHYNYSSRESKLLEIRLTKNLYFQKYIQNKFNTLGELNIDEYEQSKSELQGLLDKAIATLKL